MKTSIKNVILFLTLLACLTTAVPMAGANQSLDILQETVGNLLENFELRPHSQFLSPDPGARNIGSAILYVTDALRYAMGSIAVIYLFVMAFRLITAGDQVEDTINKEKTGFMYVVIGLIVIILSTEIINLVISDTGDISFLTGKSAAKDAALDASKIVRGLYRFIQAFMGAVAILTLVITGFRLITGGGSEDVITTQRKHMVWAIIGLIVVGISEYVVKDMIFVDGGEKIGYESGLILFAKLTDFFAGFISIFAVLAIIYAGFVYVTSGGEQERIDTAKKIFLGVIIGLFLTALAYALINTLIGFGTE